jgi:DNA-binding MarR family transcriptional regulator
MLDKKDRFFTYYTQSVLVELLKGKINVSDLSHEFKATYSNIWNVLNLLEKQGFIEYERKKVSKIISLTDKGRKLADLLQRTIEFYKSNKVEK